MNPYAGTATDYVETYYMVQGFTNEYLVHQIYPVARYDHDTAREEFTKTHHAAGVRGITVTLLYTQRRYW